jgi:uncharacterized glyoxalase superfamily protein PhnB
MTAYPALFYRDAAAAIDFLERAFGLETVLRVPGADGAVAHAELRSGDAMVLVGTEQPERGWLSPAGRDGVTALVYLVTDDVDAHCERARAAGAEITMEPRDTDYGSRDYLALDPEGNVWSVGTYRPGTFEPEP